MACQATETPSLTTWRRSGRHLGQTSEKPSFGSFAVHEGRDTLTHTPPGSRTDPRTRWPAPRFLTFHRGPGRRPGLLSLKGESMLSAEQLATAKDTAAVCITTVAHVQANLRAAHVSTAFPEPKKSAAYSHLLEIAAEDTAALHHAFTHCSIALTRDVRDLLAQANPRPAPVEVNGTLYPTYHEAALEQARQLRPAPLLACFQNEDPVVSEGVRDAISALLIDETGECRNEPDMCAWRSIVHDIEPEQRFCSLDRLVKVVEDPGFVDPHEVSTWIVTEWANATSFVGEGSRSPNYGEQTCTTPKPTDDAPDGPSGDPSTEARVLQALLLKKDKPNRSDRSIAEEVGIHPSTLSRSRIYRNAKKMLENDRADLPRGQVNDGNIEAWHDC